MSETLSYLVNACKRICGEEYVVTDSEHLYQYGKDQTGDLHFSFDILVKPSSAEQVAAIEKICNQYKMPITPRGGGTGVTGGALPVSGGVVLSLERLNKIIDINKQEGYVIAEAGVITADLCSAVEQMGLYFPVFPSSGNGSFIGGNVAENAGSVKSCKYGSTSQYVINLEVILPTGEIIWTGANVSKNATGINITSLFAGSEGTLGIITKIVYRLLSLPTQEIILLTAFDCLENACKSIISIRESGIVPSTVELICKDSLQLTAPFVDEMFLKPAANVDCQLMVGLQESTLAELENTVKIAGDILSSGTSFEILVGETVAQKEKLGRLRYSIGKALTSGNRKYRDLDACVPLATLCQYIRHVQSVCKKYGISTACFGHAMDGNMHTMLLSKTPSNEEEEQKIGNAVGEIYEFVISVGGVISGEHGIGMLQKEFMKMQFSPVHLLLMKNIKALFDPNNILNPGKVF